MGAEYAYFAGAKCHFHPETFQNILQRLSVCITLRVMKASLVVSAFAVAVASACANPADDHLAFVGEKLSVERFEPVTEKGQRLMDQAFHAAYVVKKIIHGSFGSGTISFEAYDHYDRPAFEGYRYALLFVSRNGSTYYHEKYQYFPVFQLTTGEWAGCGDPYRFEPSMHRGALKPRELPFGPEAYFDLSQLAMKDQETRFPKQHYDLKDGRAHCKMGNTVDELFEVKRAGVLRSRGSFQ